MNMHDSDCILDNLTKILLPVIYLQDANVDNIKYSNKGLFLLAVDCTETKRGK